MLTEQKPPCAAKFGVPNFERPPAGQRLRLVAAGEEGKLLRIGLLGCAKGARVAIDSASSHSISSEFAGAARAGPQQRLLQPRRAVVLHDAGAALAADHAAVHRVVLVAVDVADLAVLDVHVDAAPAGAHVAGRFRDAVGDRRRGLDAVALRPARRRPAARWDGGGICGCADRALAQRCLDVPLRGLFCGTDFASRGRMGKPLPFGSATSGEQSFPDHSSD